jgi:ketosteroid isomerase-like protein
MTPEEVFLTVAQRVCDRDYDNIHELYAEQTDVRHPMNPFGDRPLLSREALREHFASARSVVGDVIRFQPANVRIHRTTDPEVIVAEFEYAGSVTATGEPFSVPGIFVLRVRDGLIVESRDYIDHVAMLRARGQVDQLIAVLKEPAGASATS